MYNRNCKSTKGYTMLINTRVVQDENEKYLVQFETSDGWETEAVCDTLDEAEDYEMGMTD